MCNNWYRLGGRGSKEMETKNCVVYVILGYDINGIKDILVNCHWTKNFRQGFCVMKNAEKQSTI